jgi:DNA mismatch repair protein MutL
VRNLFFNVPARRKFLRSNATEFRHIFEAVKAMALAYPEIEWRMLNDDEELFHFRTPDIRERLDLFYGAGFGDTLVEITEENDFLVLGGYLGRPGMLKRRKYDQHFYINRRIVQNRMLAQAVQQAYGELLEERQSAFALLFLGIDPGRIDINVHPSKLEVRFDDERSVRNMVYPVIKRAIQMHDFSPEAVSATPTEMLESAAGLPGQDAERKLGYPVFSGQASTTRDLYRDYRSASFRSSGSGAGTEVSSPSLPLPFHAVQDGRFTVHESGAETELVMLHDDPAGSPDKPEPKIWQLHNKYIICQIKTGLMIIDQHVAHERVLYERAIDVMNEQVPNSQQLLFPQKIELRPWQFDIYREIKDDIDRLGFTVRPFGAMTVMIEGVPQDVRHGTESTILQDMISEYQDNASRLKLDKRDNLAKSYSCRNAIMTGQKLSLDEMKLLIDKLFATRMPYVCPHGRPVIIRLSLNELDRMFGRK